MRVIDDAVSVTPEVEFYIYETVQNGEYPTKLEHALAQAIVAIIEEVSPSSERSLAIRKIFEAQMYCGL